MITDEELDAMTSEEAWNLCCYAAWITRRDRVQHEIKSQAFRQIQEQMRVLILETLANMTPEERARIETEITRLGAERKEPGR